MALEPSGRDVFMRHTDPNGKTHVDLHRAWDVDAFLASQKQAADNVNNAEANPLKRQVRAEQITRDQYLAERKAK